MPPKPQLPVISGREAGKAFEKIGYKFDHQKGSHMIYYRHGGGHLSIPNHNTLDRGLLRSLIRAAGITVDEFIKLL